MATFNSKICKELLLRPGIRIVSLNSRRGIQMAAENEKPVESSIRKKLQVAFQPSHVDVVNESYMHNVPKGSESHFKVIVVSDKFENLSLIQRHRMVNDTLKDELAEGVHALSIQAKTLKQWETSDKTTKASPPCHGGFGL